MDIIKASESHFRALMDKHAFEINLCIQDQSREQGFEKLIRSISAYNKAKSGYDTVINLKNQIISSKNTDIVNNES